jgi:hypothetical protein
MSVKEDLQANTEQLKKISAIGMKAVERIDSAIQSGTTNKLNYNMEKVLSRDISAAVHSLKAEILIYRLINNK